MGTFRAVLVGIGVGILSLSCGGKSGSIIGAADSNPLRVPGDGITGRWTTRCLPTSDSKVSVVINYEFGPRSKSGNRSGFLSIDRANFASKDCEFQTIIRKIRMTGQYSLNQSVNPKQLSSDFTEGAIYQTYYDERSIKRANDRSECGHKAWERGVERHGCIDLRRSGGRVDLTQRGAELQLVGREESAKLYFLGK